MKVEPLEQRVSIGVKSNCRLLQASYSDCHVWKTNSTGERETAEALSLKVHCLHIQNHGPNPIAVER
jgi:hypothetical protein